MAITGGGTTGSSITDGADVVVVLVVVVGLAISRGSVVVVVVEVVEVVGVASCDFVVVVGETSDGAGCAPDVTGTVITPTVAAHAAMSSRRIMVCTVPDRTIARNRAIPARLSTAFPTRTGVQGSLVDHQGEDGRRPGFGEQGGGDGGRPAGAVGVVDQQRGAGRQADAVAEPHRAEQRRCSGSRRDVARRRRAVDLQGVDERELADGGEVLGERADQLRPLPRRHRDDGDWSFPRLSPSAQHGDHRVGDLGADRAVTVAEGGDGVAPRRVIGEGQRPTDAASDDLALATGEPARPQLAWLEFDVERAQVAHASPRSKRRRQRARGREARRCTPSTVRTALGSGSSSACWRNCIRHPAPAA